MKKLCFERPWWHRFPKQMTVSIGTHCNAYCPMCGIHGEPQPPCDLAWSCESRPARMHLSDLDAKDSLTPSLQDYSSQPPPHPARRRNEENALAAPSKKTDARLRTWIATTILHGLVPPTLLQLSSYCETALGRDTRHDEGLHLKTS